MVDFIRIPPDSTGKRLYTKQVTIDGTDVQAQRMQIACGVNPSEVLQIDARGAAFTRFAEGQPAFDAYSQMEITQQYHFGIYEFTNTDYSDLYVKIEETGGTIEYQPVASSLQFTTTGFSGSKAVLTSNKYHYYQQGFSTLAKLSISCGDTGREGNIRRWGYFDDNNGMFFQLDSTGICVVRRSDATGTPIDYKFYQNEWNQDKLDGTGVSAVTLSITNAYTYWIDIAFPRGVSRFGIFDPTGNRISCHMLACPGGDPLPNMGRASLPIRVSNEDISSSGTPSTIRFISGQVMAETRDPNYTFWRYGGLSSSEKTITTNTPLLSVQSRQLLENGKQNTINAFPETLSVFVDTGAIKIDIVEHNEESSLLNSPNFRVVGSCTLEVDDVSTSIDSTSSDYWITKTLYAGAGVTNFDLSQFYELNDEGVLLKGDGINRNIISFVATKLNGTTVKVTSDLSIRELW